MNKVKYGLEQVHYAIATVAEDGKVTFAKPEPILGAVTMSLPPKGEKSEFHADNILYWSQDVNDGYEGDLEFALIPDKFKVDCMGFVENAADGTIGENGSGKQKNFALLFEFSGDVTETRHVLYWCMASRASIEGGTKSKTIEPKTEKIGITASQRPDTKDIKWNTKGKDSTAHETWYDVVYEPSAP